MNTPRRVCRLVLGVFFLAPACSAIASGMGQLAAERVSETSYRHYLDDMLYTHAGDNRGFGPEHDLAQANIVFLMESFGLSVALEPVDYGGETYYNVVGTRLGTTYPDQEYIVGGHYDSVNNPGADDNASGVALVLEAAHVLGPYDSDYTIRFIAFDREEQGLHGSQDYVDAHAGDDILGMISTDMVAYNTGAGLVDIYGRSASNPIKNALAAAVDTYGDGLTASIGGALDGSDHAPFEWEGFQACLFIEDWGNPYYHTQQDNVDMPNYIDYAYATQLTRIVVGFLVDHAGVVVELPDGDFDNDGDVDIDDYDQFELCFTGPDGGPISPECTPGDFDLDDDVDCDDWDEFVLAWTEPGDPPQFTSCLITDPLPAPWPHDASKNRYISFTPNNGDISVAFAVLLTASVDFPNSAGTSGWVGETDAEGIARVVDGPFYTDAWPSVVHVGDCEIVPVATYEVRATADGIVFSNPLEVGTIAEPTPKKWGDCVGRLSGTEWTPPNGKVNFDDVQVGVRTFLVDPNAPHLTWVDLDEEVPNAVINFTDVQLIVSGFLGEGYPFSAPEDCP